VKAVLKIVKQDWTGWVTQQPKPEEIIIEAAEGDSLLEVIKGIGNPSASIKEIQDDSVVLITSHLASGESGAGIDLTKDYSHLESVLEIGESVEFSTQTMDAGISYTISLTSIKP
jgi:hypothetical protein